MPEFCPLEPGATLNLQLHDEVCSDSGSLLEVQILKSFLPFSNGQALHVRLTAPHPRLPSNLLVKLFDRRFMDRWWETENSWSPTSELAARAAWRRIQEGAASDPEASELDLDMFVPEDPWLREKLPWLQMLAKYRREREAYRRLAALQGTDIPKLFATLSWRDPQLDAAPPATHPIFAATPGLALEFVEGMSLRDFAERRTESWPTDAEERMSSKVLDIARALGRLGVIHDDIRSANIMLRSSSGEPVLIDFGNAVLRGERETEDEWTERLRNKTQINEFRRVLWSAGVHDQTPTALAPEGDPFVGYRWMNAEAKIVRSPAKRLEWFEPVPCDGPEYKKVLDEKGEESHYYFQRWRLRPGVRVRPEDEY